MTRGWFDQLEQVLHVQAELAGLLGHGTMIGDAREFFVTHVLRSVLPPSLHIGTGKIIGHDGSQSKQVDVIICDPSFPGLEVQPGHGLYFSEGVVAAIEVKSSIDIASLRESLDNCLSVTQIPPSFVPRTVTTESPEEGAELPSDNRTFQPSSYIFGYRSYTASADTFSRQVSDWWTDSDLTVKDVGKLPKVIVAGRIVGLANSRFFKVDVSGELLEKANKSCGKNAKILMGFWEVEHPFGWLLIHLLMTSAQTSQRRTGRHCSSIFRFVNTGWRRWREKYPVSSASAPREASLIS